MKKIIAILAAIVMLLPLSAAAMSQPLFTAIGQASGVSGSTRFYGCGTNGITSSSIALVAPPMQVAGVLDDLYVKLDVAPGAGTTLTYTVEKNDIDTTMVCTISDAETSCSDLDSPVTFAVGDTCGVRSQATAGAPVTTESNISNVFTGTTDGEASLTGAGSALSNSLTHYYTIFGGAATTTLLHASTTFPTSGTLDNFRVQLSGGPGAGTSFDFTVYKNGVATALACEVAGTNSSCTDADSLSVSPGDSLTFEGIPTGTPNARSPKWGFRFLPTVNGESVFMASEENNSNAVRYHSIQGLGERSTLEANVEVVVPVAFQLRDMFFNMVYGQPTGVTTRTLTARKNNANTALTLQLNSSTDWATDLSTTVDYAIGDLINTRMDFSGAPPTTVLEFWSFVAYVNPNTPTAIDNGIIELVKALIF